MRSRYMYLPSGSLHSHTDRPHGLATEDDVYTSHTYMFDRGFHSLYVYPLGENTSFPSNSSGSYLNA